MASIETSNASEPNIKVEDVDTADTTTAAATVTSPSKDTNNIKQEIHEEEESTSSSTIKNNTQTTTTDQEAKHCYDNKNASTINNTDTNTNQNNINNNNEANDDNNNVDDDDGDEQVDGDNNVATDANIKTDEDVAMTSNDNNTNEANDESNENKTNLIVNYLPQQMTDEEFEELFKKFGKMKSCKIVRNRASGYSYGFGFVDFETHEQAIKAIEELNGHELETKKIKVAFARPAGQDIKQANLYIKNIPAEWTQDQVRRHFEPYGNIIQVRVLSNNRGVAFVLYDLRKQAEDALEALNGKTIEGSSQPLEIKFAADKKSEKTNKPGKGSKSGDNSNDNASASEGGGNNPGSATGTVRKRERGHRGGRNHRLRMERRNQRAAAAASTTNDGGGNSNKPSGGGGGGGGSGSFFDRRQNDNRQRNQSRFNRNNYNNNNINNNSNNAPMYANPGMPYGGVPYNNQLNGSIGPMRQMQVNKMNRYTPFVPLQPMMGTPAQAVIAPNQPTGGPIAGPQTMTQNPAAMAAYGYPTQQSMIPYAHMMSAAHSQMATGNQMHQMTSQAAATSQLPQATPMATMYTAATSQLSHHPMAHYMMQASAPQAAAINNIYNVASNNMTNAANMQPQLGQPMNQHMRGGGNDDGVTLFVYNIGPDSDENELKTMFGPYGQVVKCNVVRKTPGGETKGFGFVTMKDRDQANGAIAGLNGSMRNGRALQVSLKK